MAKITITLTDTREGEICIQVVTTPPVKPGDKSTPAQKIAAACLAAIAVRHDSGSPN